MTIPRQPDHRPGMLNLPAFLASPSRGAVGGLPTDVLEQALSSANTVLYQWDLESGLLTFSENLTEVFPLSCSVPRNENEWLALIDPTDREEWQSHKESWMAASQPHTFRFRIQYGGKSFWVRQSGKRLESGGPVVGVIYFRCQSPQQEARGMRVSSVAMQSGGKPGATSRNAKISEYVYPEEFVERLQSVMEDVLGRKKQGALLILSIANFGMIINAYGHRSSETVVTELAAELGKLLGPEDGLYRVHRDQFGIILSDCRAEEVEKHANQISDIIHNYGHHSSVGSLHVICAIGSMTFPAEDEQATDIIDKAYVALHQTNGTVHRGFAEGPDERMLARQQMGLANYLRKAIQENKLRLAYQPIIDSHTGKVAHYEALLRLIGEDGKISSAGALIPIAERMGLIDMVDHIVLEMVVKELEQASQVKLALNVSNLTTDNAHWLQHCRNLLKNKPEIASRLMVEITETAAHRDLRRTAYFVASLQEMGCKVALDDFGSGYTSFRQLKALSVDLIKIDGAFIKDLNDNPDNRFFVKTLLEFTRCFNLQSVAEYVENGETAKMLIELGVDYMQGYYFGRPENYRSWIADEPVGR